MSSNLPREPIAIGVGLDTARYGHHATFLREDRQPAAERLETATGATSAPCALSENGCWIARGWAMGRIRLTPD